MNTGPNEPLHFAGILRLLYSNHKTGRLKVAAPDGETVLHFKEGRVVNIDLPAGGEWLIGEYLSEGGIVSDRRLMKAIRIATARGTSPEDVLVRKHWLSADVLRRYMDLYSREVILPLFTKVGMVCTFIAQEPEEHPWLPPVSVPFLLKEGEKRVREWPVLAKKIPSSDIVYGKDKSFLNQVLLDGDEAGNPLFSDKIDPDLGANERIVYYFIDGKKTICQVARAAGVDYHSTCKAVYTLETKFMVKQVAAQGTAARRIRSYLPVVAQLMMYVVLAIVVAGLALVRPGPLKMLTGERGVDVERVQAALRWQDQYHPRMAAKVLYAREMRCPASLEPAVKAGLLAPGTGAANLVLCEEPWGVRVVPAGSPAGTP